MEIDSTKWSSSGFVLLDCPQSMRMESSNASLIGSISNYFLSFSNDWDLMSYLKSLSKALEGLKLGPYSSTNPKKGSCGPCMVSAITIFIILWIETFLFSSHFSFLLQLEYSFQWCIRFLS